MTTVPVNYVKITALRNERMRTVLDALCRFCADHRVAINGDLAVHLIDDETDDDGARRASGTSMFEINSIESDGVTISNRGAARFKLFPTTDEAAEVREIEIDDA